MDQAPKQQRVVPATVQGPVSALAPATGPAAPFLSLPEEVLGPVLNAAFGGRTKPRIPFLATCKALQSSRRLWGTELKVCLRHPCPANWLHEHASIVSIRIRNRYYWEQITERNLAFLKGLRIAELAIETHFDDKEAVWLWPLLSTLPLTSLRLEQYGGSLQGLRKALPNLKKLSCESTYDTDLTLSLIHI
jgi:hypothetical protein